MFKFLKSKKSVKVTTVPVSEKSEGDEAASSAEQPTEPKAEPKGWLSRLNRGLGKTRHALIDRLSNLVFGKKQIDAELLEELETILLSADVGIEVCDKVIDQVKQKLARKELDNPDRLMTVLRQQLEAILTPYSQSLNINSSPFVLLMVGVNGAGKTTSIAKIAHYYRQQGKQIMLAAGDTFRAAAIEQLQVWGERNQVPVITQQSGADSASVIFDAFQAARARHYDILIADTAGRLHTQNHLMQELAKIKRVLTKQDPTAPHEVMLVIDASMGQNALAQAEQFHQAVGLTGICLTKLDGTARGGIIFAIADKLQVPIRFIGVGEQLEDLKPFNAVEFVNALFTASESKR